MSKTAEVGRAKRKIEKEKRARRQDTLLEVRKLQGFKARLYDSAASIEVLLRCKGVEAVIVDVPEDFNQEFARSLYNGDLSSFTIEQLSSNRYKLSRKEIEL